MDKDQPDNFIDPNHVTQTFVNGPITVSQMGAVTLVQFTQVIPFIENLPAGTSPPPRQAMVACRLVMQEGTVQELMRLLAHRSMAVRPVAGTA